MTKGNSLHIAQFYGAVFGQQNFTLDLENLLREMVFE